MRHAVIIALSAELTNGGRAWRAPSGDQWAEDGGWGMFVS